MSDRVKIEWVRDLERRIASLEQRVENLATLVEGPPPWDDDIDGVLAAVGEDDDSLPDPADWSVRRGR